MTRTFQVALITLALVPRAAVRAQDAGAPRPLVAHEWGVFRFVNARADYLEELAAELPPFVIRTRPTAPDAARDRAGEAIPSEQSFSYKPVVFLYGDAPRVEVDVEFPGGEPWLVYPRTADVTSTFGGGRVPHVLWQGPLVAQGSGRASGTGTANLAATMNPIWTALRNVRASIFGSPPSAGMAENRESFLFYDGPTSLTRPLRFEQGGIIEGAFGGEVTQYLMVGPRRHPANAGTVLGAVRELNRRETNTRRRECEVYVRTHERGWRIDRRWNVPRAQVGFLAMLVDAGLSRDEAIALETIWHHDLFEYDGRQLIYILPRAAYDAALPIRISPTPSELVRVGVVIDRG